MSRNTASPSVSSSEQPNSRKPKRKVQRVRLPTPPPDPRLASETSEASANPEDKKQKDAEFLDYLEALQKFPNPSLARSASIFAPTIAAEDAFDHLDKLYKLMEQMLVLREQNAKLHRRIRDLEHLRNLQNLHKQLENSEVGDYLHSDLDKDTAFAESLLDTMLIDSKRDFKARFTTPSRLRQSLMRRQRNRSGSVVDKSSEFDFSGNDRRSSAVITPNSDKSSKVSKWTKVKAAFKWEKASTFVGGAKTPDSDSGLVPLNYEVARYLRVPSTSEDIGSSPVDSGAAGISTPGTISSASSLEDLRYGRKGEARDFSSDDDQSYTLLDYIPHSKEESTNVHKSANKSPTSRTPWAKMKDIIQPRSSIKKRYRLSARSDDLKLEDSDNEEVFLLDGANPPSSEKPKLEKSRSFPERSHRIPPEVIERYQNLIAEDNMTNKDDPESKISRWTRVKKAFLTSPSISRITNEDENANLQAQCCRKDVTKPINDPKVHAEIKRKYRQLQKELSLEFQNRMSEWEKNKLSSPGHNASSSATASVLSSEDVKDQAFIKKMEEWEKIKSQPRLPVPMTSEENLPPEFKKKLQEWQKIKKSSIRDESTSSTTKKKLGDVPKCKSIGGYKVENSPLDQRPLSHDFLKKLETWKQIKAGAIPYPDDADGKRITNETKTPSPRMARKDSSTRQSKKFKEQTDKELQWFEKELGKIEREKQRLERERQKFLEREERLSKLRRSVIGNNKKEVLVHTPTGFYRFEGISRKFTQKLYEWEKAQGIGPEASTFALLTSSCSPEILMLPPKRDYRGGTLYRSKSADSIANSVQNLVCPMLSEQPSSLSLNDVDNLEKNCMLDSRVSSMPDVIGSDEPEAVIVEVEDVYEETAAPLVTFFDKQETPVYQHQQENRKLCEGKKNSGPKVRRSESTRAQTNYNLIEDAIKILKTLIENERDVEEVENKDEIACSSKVTGENIPPKDKTAALKDQYERQFSISKTLTEKLMQLQQANTTVAANITNEESSYTMSHLIDVLDNVQDLSSELLQLAEKLCSDLNNRQKHGPQDDTVNFSKANYPNISFSLKLLNTKILEIRRELSYICAASDLTAPGKKKKFQKRGILRRKSQEESGGSTKQDSSKKESSYPKEDDSSSVDNAPIPVGQGAIRKRIRYRQKEPTFYKVVNESDEDEESYREQRKIRQKRFSKSRSGSEGTSTDNPEVSLRNNDSNITNNIIVDPEIVQKVVVPTRKNFLDGEASLDIPEANDSPVTLFVKTTRKLFTPIATSSLGDEPPAKQESPAKLVPQFLSRKSLSPSNSPKNSPRMVRKFSLSSNLRTSSFSNRPAPLMESKSENNINDKPTGNTEQNLVSEPLVSQSQKSVTHLPPSSASPIIQRKVFKEISPSIRIMMAKYNQKISEQDNSGALSGGSSGSASPTAWRSPVSERRVKAQTERYQEELNKLSPLLGKRREIQKSSSVELLHSGNKQVTVHSQIKAGETSPESSPKTKRGILKSSSTIIQQRSSNLESPTIEEKITMNPRNNEIRACLKLSIPVPSCSSDCIDTPDDRKLKILKAREEFLNSPLPSSPSPPTSSASNHANVPFNRSRLSQVSVGSESSCDSGACGGWLVKSASAGMINIDPNVYKQFDPAVHQDGYVSLPRSNKKPKEGFLSNLTSKFRKVKMRRNKEHNKMNTISTLCRQSLVVDISSDSQETLQKPLGSSKDYLNVPSDTNRGSSSEDMSAESSRSGRWIARPKLFKPRQ